MDTAGNLYIAAGDKIRKVDTAGTITTYAGTGLGVYNGDGIPATSAQFTTQGQIAMDNYGNLYIADGANQRIRKISALGIITTVAGNGIPGYYGDGGLATAAQLNDPTGVFPDNCDNIYIADSWNNRVRMVNGKGIITTIAGNGFDGGTGSGGYSGDGDPATTAKLYLPSIVYLDKNGSIYIADSYNFRVRYIHMDSCINTTGIAMPPSLSKEEETLTVWPNPNLGSFTFKLLSADNEAATVVITNIVGAKVKEFTTTTNKETEAGLHVPGGVYLMSVSTEHGRWVEKVMVNP